jgi:hypothetical protein
MEDKRELKTFERTLGDYEVAGAICSYGDVINFVDGDSNGIVLIDTMGHYEESGIKMGEFIRKQISEGWGHKDPRENIFDLRDALKLERESHGERWCTYVSGISLRLDDFVSFSTAGEMGPIVCLVNRACDVWSEPYHRIDIMNEDRIDLLAYKLKEQDLIFVQSDGLVDNLAYSLRNHDELDLERESLKALATEKVVDLIKAFSHLPPSLIGEGLVNKYGDLFLPRDNYYDDVTFAIIKKK